MTSKQAFKIYLLLMIGVFVAGRSVQLTRGMEESNAHERSGDYTSPYAVDYSSDGLLLAVTDSTRGRLEIMDLNGNRTLHSLPLEGEPRGLVWHSDYIYVAQYDAWKVSQIDPSRGEVVREFQVGPKAVDVAVTDDKLLVTEYGLGQLIVADLDSGEEAGRVELNNYPFFLDVTVDGEHALVGHKIPTGNAMDSHFASELWLVDLESLEVSGKIELPHGSANVREVAMCPGGRWAYAVHTMGKTNLPTTHIHKGWVNTNALSIIDVESGERYATVLLDRMSEGASDPWGVAVSSDGEVLWVSVAGTHQVIRLDMAHLHLLLAGEGPSFSDELARSMRYRSKAEFDRPYSDVWLWVSEDPESNRSMLEIDLGALWGAGVMEIVSLPGQGPRGLAVSPDDSEVAAVAYFAGEIFRLDSESLGLKGALSAASQPEEGAVRRGERKFHDGTLSMQHWLSCATCHPDGRADGLNWDLPNDGLGNPNNTKTLLLSHETPPAMARGVRESAELAVATGFRFISFVEPGEQVLDDVRAYMAALEPEISPFRTRDGNLTEEAEAGREIFESERTGCLKCHPGPYYTDNKIYDVGTKNPVDSDGDFVTPHLIELWRRAPFNHDGAAVTMRDVLTTKNPGDKHGVTSHLSDEEIDQLEAYLLQMCVDTVPED